MSSIWTIQPCVTIVYRLLAVGLGLLLYLGIFQRALAVAVVAKVSGHDEPCPWSRLLRYPLHMKKFGDLQSTQSEHVQFLQKDEALGIEQYQTATRKFWLKSSGRYFRGSNLLAYVLAEQEWLSTIAPDQTVKAGMVVMDVGAHVGTFGDDALRRGAAKVIMVEADPVNAECIRRNFAPEIQQGRVVLIAEGAWSKPDTLEFAMGVANSGTGSFVLSEDESRKIKIPVNTIDNMLQRIGVSKVDYLKMDIEGAEREALRGAHDILHSSKPVIFLDAYHLRDDSEVLPPLILQANPAYRALCAACTPSRHDNDDRIVPYAIFFY